MALRFRLQCAGVYGQLGSTVRIGEDDCDICKNVYVRVLEYTLKWIIRSAHDTRFSSYCQAKKAEIPTRLTRMMKASNRTTMMSDPPPIHQMPDPELQRRKTVWPPFWACAKAICQWNPRPRRITEMCVELWSRRP